VVLKFIFRDFRNSPWFFFFFILNFAIGLTGFVAIDSFKVGIQKSLKENSKEYLSADLVVSARRKLLNSEVQTAVDSFKEMKINSYQEGKLVEFFTMVATPNGSRLVQLKAVDESYPFYGKMILKKNGVVANGVHKEINHALKAWVYPELLTQLNLKIGDKVKIGKLEFELADAVIEDSTQTFRLASIAPKIYIGYHAIEETGLIQLGSTLSDARLYKLNTDEELTLVKKNLFKKYIDPSIQVSSPEDAEEDSGRTIGYLNDYLGLVSLVGLFLAMIGATYLFRSFLNSKIQSIAVLNVLGLDFKKAFWITVLQLIITGFLSALVALALSAAIIPFIQNLVEQLTSSQITAHLQPQSVVIAIFVSIFGILFSSFPYLISMNRIETAELLQESVRLNLPIRLKDYFYFTPLILFFYILSILQSNSFKVGSLFFGCLFGSIFVLYLFAVMLLKIFSYIKTENQSFNQAVLYITRKRSNSIPTLLSLSVAALLLNLIPQLKVGLLEEFQIQKNSKVPSLFLFDIQDEQVSDLKKILNEENTELNNLSPMIRARIISVNDTPFEKNVSSNQVFKTREEETEARFRNRGFNLSYRNYLSSAEKITDGHFPIQKFDSSGNNIPEVSIEKKFAERLGFQLADKLKFDIQGVEIEGIITSFRSVKWNSFQPNFFILFQSGVLDESPKSWLASIAQIDQTKNVLLQNKIVEKFPNISIVDIERTVRRVLDMITKMSLALQFMSFLSLLAGVFVIYSISREQTLTRRWDLNLTKILGSQRSEIFKQNIFEALLIGFSSAFIGVLISIFLAYFLSIYVFGGVFTPDLFWPMVSISVISIVTISISLLTGRRVSNENPSIILRDR